MSKVILGKGILYSPYHNVWVGDIVMGRKPLQWQCITSRARDEWEGAPYQRFRVAISVCPYEKREEGSQLLYSYVNRGGKNLNLLIQKFEWDEESQSSIEYNVVDPIPLKQFVGPNFNTRTKRGLKKVAKRVRALFQK